MSDPAFIRQYRQVYAILQFELLSHTGQCRADGCKDYAAGFRSVVERLPKPPPEDLKGDGTAADLARVRREAFEEAARVADRHAAEFPEPDEFSVFEVGAARDIAAAIRSLASTPEAP